MHRPQIIRKMSLHFLVRFGRSIPGMILLPTTTCVGVMSYYTFHFIGHNHYIDFWTAFDYNGVRETPSDDVKDIVSEVEKDLREKKIFNRQLFDAMPAIFESTNSSADDSLPLIRFFISSSMDPISLGFTDSTNGATIGVPQYFNYNTVSDLPETLYSFSRFNLLRSFASSKNQEEEEDRRLFEEVEKYSNPNKLPISTTLIDKNSTQGKLFSKSMIMDRNAKKFAIAKQLFMADSYSVFVKTGNVLISLFLPMMLIRNLVSKKDLFKKPLTTRLRIYLPATLLSVALFYFNNYAINSYYQKKSDSRAFYLGRHYCEGAITYLSKTIERNKILRELIENGKRLYTEEGNTKNLFHLKDYNLSDRLNAAKKVMDEYYSEENQGNDSVKE